MEVGRVKRDGFVKVKVTIRNSEEPDRKEELEVVADMAMYMVPRHILENIGIRSLERRVFTLASGERIEREFGGAIFEVEEECEIQFRERGL